MTYPDGDALVPESFDEHTVIFLMRPENPPPCGEEELDRLQVEHLTFVRDLQRRGVIIANGPFAEQTDERLRGISIYSLPLAEALDSARWWTAAGTARFGGD